MENQQPNTAPKAAPKKKFKIPKWAFSLGALVLVVAIIVSTVAITTAATRNPGIRVLENYLNALQRGNVRNFVSAFEARGTDEFDNALNRYRDGVSQFNALNRDSEAFEEVWNRNILPDPSASEPIGAQEAREQSFRLDEYGNRRYDIDLGIDFYVERQIARSIIDYTYEIIINDLNVIQLRVVFLFDPPIIRTDETAYEIIPARYWHHEIRTNPQGQMAVSATRYLNFRRINNRWVFADGFRLFRRDQYEIETWFRPITIDRQQGYELMNVNANDIPSNGHFDATYHNNLPILSIANRAFMNVARATAHHDDNVILGHRLREITLHGDIKNIGVSAFERALDLQHVHFADITEDMTQEQVLNRNRTRPLVVGDAAFKNTRSLRSFTLSHTANPVIPSHAFAITITAVAPAPPPASDGGPGIPFVPMRQRGLTSFDFRGFSAIGHFAFRGTGLTNINLWEASGDNAFDTIRTIGEGAFEFSSVSTLTSEFYGAGATRVNNRLSDNLTRIGANAFRHTSINQLALSNYMTSVPFGIVDGNINFNAFRFGSNLREIEAFAFRGTALTRLDLPASVEHIGTAAFENTRLLRYVNFPQDTILKTIGVRAFQNTISIISLELPETIQSLGEAAFSGATNLRFVFLNVEPNIALGAGVFTIAQGIPKFYVRGDRQVNQYQGGRWAEISPQWNGQVFSRNIVQDGVAILETGNQVISPLNPNQTKPERVLIQFLYGHAADGVVELRDSVRAVQNLDALNITAIAEGAFARDSLATRVLVDVHELTWVGANAFYGAENMRFIEARVASNARLRLIGDHYDFREATGMWLIDGVHIGLVPAPAPLPPQEVITNEPFPYTVVDLRMNRRVGALINQFDLRLVVGIANSAFANVSALNTVHFGATRFIGESAFAGTGALASITFGGVTSTDQENNIPNEGRILQIGDDAFTRASSLTSVEFSSSLISVGDRAFYSTPRLRYAIINSESLNIGTNSFSTIDNVLKLYVNNLLDAQGNIRSAFNSGNWAQGNYHDFMFDLNIRYYDGNRTNFAIIGDTLIQYLGHVAVAFDTNTFETVTHNPATHNPGLANVSIIGPGAFATSQISRLAIGENIHEIHDNAFFGLDNLSHIDFTNSSGIFGDGVSPLRRIGNRAFFEAPEIRQEGRVRIYHAEPHPEFTMGQESFELFPRLVHVRERAPFSGRYIRATNAEGEYLLNAAGEFIYVREQNIGNADWRRYEVNHDIITADDDPSVEVSMLIVEGRHGQGNAGTITVGLYTITSVDDEPGTVDGRPRHTTILSAVPSGVNGFAFRGWMQVYDPINNPEHTRLSQALGYEYIDGVRYVRVSDAAAFVYRFRTEIEPDKLFALFERVRVSIYVETRESSARVYVFAPARPGNTATSTYFSETVGWANAGLLPVGQSAANFYRDEPGYGAYVVLTANSFMGANNTPNRVFNGWSLRKVRATNAPPWYEQLPEAEYGALQYEEFDDVYAFARYLIQSGSTIRVLGTVDNPIIPTINIGAVNVTTSQSYLAQMSSGQFLARTANGDIFIINRTIAGINISSQVMSMVRVFIADQDIRATAIWA
ncbi:MAG: leucine-rich repeat domain-containing protein [Firmicutes bacterium]|nr:leucine-rich repeat domain-containing protein [Bacillota bacterium]